MTHLKSGVMQCDRAVHVPSTDKMRKSANGHPHMDKENRIARGQKMDLPGFDPGTSPMLREHSTN